MVNSLITAVRDSSTGRNHGFGLMHGLAFAALLGRLDLGRDSQVTVRAREVRLILIYNLFADDVRWRLNRPGVSGPASAIETYEQVHTVQWREIGRAHRLVIARTTSGSRWDGRAVTSAQRAGRARAKTIGCSVMVPRHPTARR
jgi:hypothetical protein